MAASPNIIEITGIPKKVTVAPVKQAVKAPAISFLTHPILTIATDTSQLKPTVRKGSPATCSTLIRSSCVNLDVTL